MSSERNLSHQTTFAIRRRLGSVVLEGGLLCCFACFYFLYCTNFSPFIDLSDLKGRLQRLPLLQ